MYPLISVIVPIYNIERYVGLCIESIINQTYKNLEIILVDDGGKDRCPEICDLYAEKDERIKVIHKSNGGLVSARKAGLQESNGTYIIYVDGDDWIGAGFIESMYYAMSTTNADVVCAGHSRDLFSKSERFYNAVSLGIYENEKLEDLWERMLSCGSFYRPGITTYVWNKLFKREMLLPVQMKVDNRISIGEDAAVTYPYLFQAKKVVVTENTAYHYRQREDSMLKQSVSFLDEAKKLRYLYDYLIHWAGGNKGLCNQVVDYVLSIAIIRSGGTLPQDTYSTFDKAYYNKSVVIYSAGTFGQQLVKRFHENGHCKIVGWLDDDYWEYRRCCMDVDPVESITKITFDYVLIASVDPVTVESIIYRLLDLGVERRKILTVQVLDERKGLLEQFLNIDALTEEEQKRKNRVYSHA